MRQRIEIRPRADQDIDEYFLFLGRQSVDLAVRFHEAAFGTFEQIARSPGIGRPREFENKDFGQIRSFAIDGFPNHLVFYRVPDEHVIAIIRVRHGAMDLDAIQMDE